MDNISLLAFAITAGGLILIIILVGVFLDRRRFLGYEEFRQDARVIQAFLKAQLFRDVHDLVISGGAHGYRTTVRFSRSEHTPGLTIRMSVPSNLSLTVFPKEATIPEGGVLVRTGNEQLDLRYVVRTDQPTQTRLFLNLNATIPQLKALCCSSKTFFNVEEGAIELIELTVPEEDTAEHLIAHVRSLAMLGPVLAQMPGASDVKVEKITPPRPLKKYGAVAAIIVLFVAGVAALAGYERERSMETSSSQTGTPVGIPNNEAQHIPDLAGWRLATSGDFDPEGVAWLRKHGIFNPSGRVEADFLDRGVPEDHAYVLINSEGWHRVVVLTSDNRVLLDHSEQNLALAARVPKAQLAAMPIQSGDSVHGMADGLLLVREKDDLHSAVVVSFNGSSVISAVPENYKNLSLE